MRLTSVVWCTCVVATFVLTHPSVAAIESGLIHHWSFDGNASDAVGGADGTATNVSLTVDRFGTLGSAFYFNGSDAHVALPDDTLSAGLVQGTLSAWIRVDSFDSTIFNRGIAALSSSLHFTVNADGYLVGPLSDQVPPPSTDQVSLGQWTFVALTWDGTSLSYFINGVEAGTFAFNGTVSDPYADNPFVGPIRADIGVDDQDINWFHGSMDDVRIHNRVLSGAELQALLLVPEPSSLMIAGGIIALLFRRL